MTNDKDRTPVAQNVITMCTKCDMELNHVVIAHNAEGFVEKVKCHTCGTEHRYRPDNKRSTRKTSKKSISTLEVDLTKGFEKLAGLVQRCLCGLESFAGGGQVGAFFQGRRNFRFRKGKFGFKAFLDFGVQFGYFIGNGL